MIAIKKYTDFKLCEGPTYIKELDSLFWVDILDCKVHRYNYKTEEKMEYLLPDVVGAIVPYNSTSIVCCVGDSLCYLNVKTGKIEKTVKIYDNPLLRFNDAKCDKYGNLWAGTMCRDFSAGNPKGKGSLFCIKNDVVVKEYKDFTIPNGMDWDGNIFYHIDTYDSTIYKYIVEDEVKLTSKQEFIKMEESPDGMTLDADKNIWTALWGSGKVICISTKTKEIIEEIEVDTANSSCVSFGEKDYKTIYISSGGNDGLSNGSLYTVRSNYSGKKANRYKR
jgi:sugar lactone lactonase YvrE